MTRVVITGAGSGIGAATAKHYAARGADVVAVDIDGEAAERTAHSCPDDTVRVEECDVADAAAMAELAARVHATGPVDVLVNNAGVGTGGPFLDQPLADWEWLRSINIDGVVHGCRSFGPQMIERGSGHVVNVASGAAWVSNRRMAAYCTSKAAVLMLSRCLRAEWRPHGVGVSAVCPGIINTPIVHRTRLTSTSDREFSRIVWAFRHAHRPEAVAKAIARAVDRSTAVVPVGIEAHLARLTPQPALDLLARL